MILQLWISFVFAGSAAQILAAKTSKDIERQHQREQIQKILEQRCRIEIQQRWVPLSCFQWLENNSFPDREHNQFQNYFHAKCLQATETSTISWRVYRALKKQRGECFSALQKKYHDQIYQDQRHADWSTLRQGLQLGKKFEIIPEDERKNPTKNRRL